jgi:hypothetical protein
MKKSLRDTEADVKEAWRRSDGEESVDDKLANAGDRMRNAVADAGDTLHERADEASRRLEYEHGRADEAADREAVDDRV